MNMPESKGPRDIVDDWRDLAIFDGKPNFSEPLHVGRPNIPSPELVLSLISDALDGRWLTNNGPLLQRFEAAVAADVGVKHCVAMCNGTAALELLIEGMELEGEVIVPSFTFIATAHALHRKGLRPVFCDVQKDAPTLDPDHVGSLIGPRTSAILGVHLWGRPCAPDALEVIAKKNNLGLIFDAAHAFGCKYKGRMLASYGDAAALSFHATKVLTTFEGGAVVTNDGSLAEKLRLLRNFGISESGQVTGTGTNAKLNEAAAAMGLASLAEFERIIDANRLNFDHYTRTLSGIPRLGLLPPEYPKDSTLHYVVVNVDTESGGLSRDEILAVLWAENVRARRYFHPGCHRVPPYAEMDLRAPLPITEQLSERILCLPTGTSVLANDIECVAGILRVALSSPEEVRSGLARYLEKVDFAHL